MAGKKGRSGRRPFFKQIEIDNLVDLSTKILHKALTSDEVSDTRKQEISLEILKKFGPSKIEHTLSEGLEDIIIGVSAK